MLSAWRRGSRPWGQRRLIYSSLTLACMRGATCSNDAAEAEYDRAQNLSTGLALKGSVWLYMASLKQMLPSLQSLQGTPRWTVCLVAACHQSHPPAHCRVLQAQASQADAVPRAQRLGGNVPAQQAATSHCTAAAGRSSRPPSQPAAAQTVSRPPSAARLPALTRRKGGTPAAQAGGGALVAGRQAGAGGGASAAPGGEALQPTGSQQPLSLQAPSVPASQTRLCSGLKQYGTTAAAVRFAGLS